MADWIERIPQIDLTLAGALAAAGLVALLTRRRGGRFRGLPGWVGFSVIFAVVLVALSRASPWLSLAMLGLLMFAQLRTYFFVAPMRPRDRYAVLTAYLTIPLALYPGFIGSPSTFVATVPIILILLFPVLLSIGVQQEGLLESIGRILLGVLLFVFCTAHLGLFVHWDVAGMPELFIVLIIAAELPQRLAGRFRQGWGWFRPMLGALGGALLASTVGFWAGPMCGLVEEDGARAGLLVAIAVTLGALVASAVARDLARASSTARISRGDSLDRAIPAVYAAPVFFHYLNHFV